MAEYIARREVAVTPTEPHATGCYLKVVSNNAGVVTIVCNGITYVSGVDFTMTPYGHAYYGEINVLNLTDLQYYPWTVIQGSFTDSGTCNRLPQIGEPHTVVLFSCDNNTNFSNQNNNNPETVVGNWDTVKALLDAGTFISLIVGVDDATGYVDSKNINDSYDGTCSGWTTTNSIQNGGNADDASLAYLAFCGCLGSTNTIVEGDLALTVDLVCHWGREKNRAYISNRLAKQIVDGDHNYINDHGYLTNSQAGSNPRWETYQVTKGEGKIAFENFIETAGLTISNAGITDAHANHWTIKAGNIKFSAFDQVTNAYGSIGSDNSIPDVQMNTVYGINQFTDIKAEINSSPSQFNLLLFPSGILYLGDGATGKNYLAQNPLFNHCTAEHEALFTNTTDGLASNGNTNGAFGVTVAVIGDLHRRNVQRLEIDAYPGNNAWAMELWHAGTMNGSSNTLNQTGLTVGDSYVNAGNIGTANVNLKATLLHDEDNDSGDKVYSFVLVEDIPASKPIIRMSHVDTHGDIVYQREYTTGKGNLSKEIGLDYSNSVSINSDL